MGVAGAVYFPEVDYGFICLMITVRFTLLLIVYAVRFICGLDDWITRSNSCMVSIVLDVF